MNRFDCPQRNSQRTSVAAGSSRRGAMLVFIAISMVVLLGFLAMTLDIGAGYRQRRIAQTAADAGALAGASEILRLNPPDSIRSAALAEAVRNGFDAGDVTVNYPPATGPHTSDSMFVEVTISKSISSIFGSFFNVNSLTAGARAVGGVSASSLTCIYSLEPTAANALKVDNGGELDTNCGTSVNSTDPAAINVGSSGQFTVAGSSIGVSGGWTGNKTPTPTPSTGTAAVPNPLASISMPAVGACTSTGLITITKDTTLSPGVYCGGLYLGNKTATLTAGTYIIRGGGIENHGGIMRGTGVTLINSIDPSGTYAFKPVTFGNGCKTTLTAPTSGTFMGILMYGDPAGPANAVNTYACAADIPPELTGVLYFPTQNFLFDGSNAGTQLTGTIIAKSVEISGKVTIVNQTGPTAAVKRRSLVE